MWHGLGLMVCVNMSLTTDWYIALLYDCLHSLMDDMYPYNAGLFQQGKLLSPVAQHQFKEHSRDFWWMMQLLHLLKISSIKHLWDVVVRGLFICKTYQLQISETSGHVSKWHDSTSSNYLCFQSHDEVLHDISHLFFGLHIHFKFYWTF